MQCTQSQRTNGPARKASPRADWQTTFTPRVDIYEADGELTIYADLPGVLPEDAELDFEKDELPLHGRVRPRGDGRQPLLREFETGDFRRVFRLGRDIDGGNITASLKNGVLTLRL